MRTCGVFTENADGTDRRHLGEIGHITGLKHSTTLPGGDDQCSLVLLSTQAGRPAAIRPGRTLTLSQAGLLWTGRLDEPVPQEGGWQVQAHGTGTFGSLWQAYYTGKYGGDNPVDAAISRGLPWINDGLDASIDSTQIPDPAADSIADHLTAITDPVTRTWRITRTGHLTTLLIPTTPSRLLVLEQAAARALAEVPTRLWIRYQKKAGVYDTTYVDNATAAGEFGVTERYADFGDAGVMTASAAQARASKILAKYQAVGWVGPLTATAGRYLTITGAEVDLANERACEVVQPVFAGPASEGEWVAGYPPTFVTGQCEYDWDAETLQLTPWESARRSLSDLLSDLAPKAKT
jgi:hypothetical protein